MNKSLARLVVIVLMLLLTATIFFSVDETNKLLKEKERLILKNDSLHVLQLKTKGELAALRKHLDSVVKSKDIYNLKNRRYDNSNYTGTK